MHFKFQFCWSAVSGHLLLFSDVLGQRSGSRAHHGGDFNASIGRRQDQDDVTHIGTCGFGVRDSRGQTLVRWILEQGLQVLSRKCPECFGPTNWTCRRAGDGALVQIDFLLGHVSFDVDDVWNDFCVPVGVDHRRVHARIRLPRQPWRPRLDADGLQTNAQQTYSHH